MPISGDGHTSNTTASPVFPEDTGLADLSKKMRQQCIQDHDMTNNEGTKDVGASVGFTHI